MVKWEASTLEKVSSSLVRGPFGGALKKEIFVENGYRVYEQQDAIYGSNAVGRYYITSDKFNELLRFAVTDSDFIVSCSGTIGRIYRLPKNTAAGVINQALLKITIDESQIVPDFFLQYFQWNKFQQSIIDDTQGGAMKNLVGMDKFRLIEIPLPPLPEQRRIAEVLSDTDAYIVAIEKLIAKKQAIKKGVMQELLTGKRRLPGFSGEWVEKSLNDFVVSIIGGGTPSRTNPTFWNGNIPWVTVKDFATFDSRSTQEYISDIGLNSSAAHLIPKGIPIIATRMGLGQIVIYDVDVAINQDLKAILLNASIDVKYFVLWFRGKKTEFESLGTGSTVKGITLEQLREFPISLPSALAEQTAIAEILSDMDEDIDALTAKLHKIKNIKQGMMSELLTGRIRLTEQETEAIPETVAAPKVVELSKQKPQSVAARSGGHNQQFDDAVMIAGIVDALYSEKYPLGRKKVQKCLYLLRRRQDESTEAFKKKAAGPYADEVRYKGGEPIARRSKYISTSTAGGKGTAFARGADNGKALNYIKKWGRQNDIKWVADKLKFRSVNELELLATVDMAICDLTEIGIPISVESIKHLISTNEQWKGKLKKQTFSDANISRAIRELQTLLQGGN